MMNEPTPSQPSRLRPASVAAVLGAVLVVALLGYGLVASGTSTTINDSLARGEPVGAPGFELAVLDAGSVPRELRPVVGAATADGLVSLEELRGVPVVLNFWASWCVPCREEARTLQRGWQRDGEGVVLYLGLDMQDLTEDAIGFVEEFGITYPTIRDPTNAVARSYGATGVPETFFITARGEVVAHVLGVVSPEQLQSGVRAARTGQVESPTAGGEIRPQR